MLIEVGLLIVAFIVIWLATSLAIESIEKLSSHTSLSKFALALFVIGTVTSLPEITVTLNAILLNSPQIALGNLIGSQIFLLFLVIPVWAIANQGFHLQMQMKNTSLALMLLVASIPLVALLNQSLEVSDVVIILGAYIIFVTTFSRQNTFLEKLTTQINHSKKIKFGLETAKLIAAVTLLLLASNTAVRAMIEISALLQTPRFLLSLLVLPIGTNLPELSLALGSLALGKKALGDYMGAITFNSLLLAALALGVGGSIAIGQNISLVILAFVGGVIIFWWCCYSKEILSIKEGLLLLLVYVTLLIVAASQIMSGILL